MLNEMYDSNDISTKFIEPNLQPLNGESDQLLRMDLILALNWSTRQRLIDCLDELSVLHKTKKICRNRENMLKKIEELMLIRLPSLNNQTNANSKEVIFAITRDELKEVNDLLYKNRDSILYEDSSTNETKDELSVENNEMIKNLIDLPIKNLANEQLSNEICAKTKLIKDELMFQKSDLSPVIWTDTKQETIQDRIEASISNLELRNEIDILKSELSVYKRRLECLRKDLQSRSTIEFTFEVEDAGSFVIANKKKRSALFYCQKIGFQLILESHVEMGKRVIHCKLKMTNLTNFISNRWGLKLKGKYRLMSRLKEIDDKIDYLSAENESSSDFECDSPKEDDEDPDCASGTISPFVIDQQDLIDPERGYVNERGEISLQIKLKIHRTLKKTDSKMPIQIEIVSKRIKSEEFCFGITAEDLRLD